MRFWLNRWQGPLHEELTWSSAHPLRLVHSLVNVLGANQFSEDVVPTVAFNLRQVRKGNVVMKIWDVAVSSRPRFQAVAMNAPDCRLADSIPFVVQGQPKFRNMWDRYARGADAILQVAFIPSPVLPIF